MKYFFIVPLFLLTSFLLSAQGPSMRYGKIDKKLFDVISFNGDSSISAIVLADVGYSEVKYDENKGFYLFHERHTRIKILTSDGFDYADLQIPLYHNSTSSELLSTFKASTYNQEGSKVVTSKLKKKAGFKEKVNDNWDNIKFTMPDVKEGSILEYTYGIRSDFIFNLQDWVFQSDIPTLWSEYKVATPEYYSYQKLMQGFHPMIINKENRIQENIKFTNKQSSGAYSSSEVTYQKDVYHWAAENLPAFKVEPYMSSVENYISKVVFELALVNFPNSAPNKVMGTWPDINRSFLESSNFGGRMRGNAFLNDIVAGLIEGAADDTEKIAAIYNYVKGKVKWNGRYRKYANGSFKELLAGGEGTNADINLLLGNMLKKADIQVSPVLLSTRSNGFIKKTIPVSSQFNYVIIEALVNGIPLLLDATERTLPIGLLPLRVLNEEGFRVSANDSGWLPIRTKGSYGTVVSIDVALSEEGVMKGETLVRHSDYRAQSTRKAVEKQGDEFKSNQEKATGWSIADIAIADEEDLEKPISVTYEMETNKGVEVLGDLIYINPFITEHMTETPFKLEERNFPVDFIAPQKMNYLYTLKIPEGFKVDELPKPIAMALPDKAGVFRYFVQAQGQVINIRYQMSINQTLFTSVDYEGLREFYNQMVQKQGEQIVLKKTGTDD